MCYNTKKQKEFKMTKKFILDFLQAHKDELSQKYALTKIGLFGSFARDEATEDSDIDISIETNIVDPYKFVHLKEELSVALKKPIDLVRFRTSMNPYLKESILKDAIYV